MYYIAVRLIRVKGVLKNPERILRWSALRSVPYPAAAVERSHTRLLLWRAPGSTPYPAAAVERSHTRLLLWRAPGSTPYPAAAVEGSGEHSTSSPEGRYRSWSAPRSSLIAGYAQEEHSTVVCSRLEGSGEHSSLIGFI